MEAHMHRFLVHAAAETDARQRISRTIEAWSELHALRLANRDLVLRGRREGTDMKTEQMVYDNFNDALIAAHRHSRMVECGYAFAVQWPLGHCTVEFRKPSLRDQRMRVVECSDGREVLA